MANAIDLQMIVLHLSHAIDAPSLPCQVLACALATLTAGHAAVAVRIGFRPRAPWMLVERTLAQWRQFFDELFARIHAERGRNADVLQHAARVVEPEQQ